MKTIEQVREEYHNIRIAEKKAWTAFKVAEAPIDDLRNTWHQLHKQKEHLEHVLTYLGEPISSDEVASVEEAVSSSKDVEGSFPIPSQPSAVSEEKQQ